jgi:ParB/RepB/Spo0J family partition protein
MQITYIDPEYIYSDRQFNSRGAITAFDVVDLVDELKKHGLLQPIVVQLYNQDEYTHKIIAGHRRHLAWTIAFDDKPMPCVIQDTDTDPISEQEARVLNLVENMKRKDINIVQEAKAIEHLVKSGMTNKAIANELGVSTGWVQTRHNILFLPEDIQQEVALGILTTQQIQQLYSVRAYPDTMRNLYKAMKDGRKAGRTIKVERHKALDSRVKRNGNDMIRMIEFLGAIQFGFHTRCLAWAAGTITTAEFFNDVRDYCDEHGLDYPAFPDRF